MRYPSNTVSFGCSHRILYSNRYLLNSSLLFFSRFFFSLSKNMKWHYFTFRFRILTHTQTQHEYCTTVVCCLRNWQAQSNHPYIRIIMRIWYSSECSSTANNVVCRICVSCEWMAKRRVRCMMCVCLSSIRSCGSHLSASSSSSSSSFIGDTIVCAYVT